MLIVTDSTDYGERCTGVSQWGSDSSTHSKELNQLIDRAFSKPVWTSEQNSDDWTALLLTERASRSQFDLLVELCSQGVRLPDRLVCCAGSGHDFHGFKNRRWEALEGNIHLSACYHPAFPLPGFGVPFILLGVFAVLRVLDSFRELRDRFGVKWVNDLLIDGRKVGGVLVRVQTQREKVTSAVLGIGLNVKSSPKIASTPFVPRAAALKEFLDTGTEISERLVLNRLLAELAYGYRLLQSNRVDVLRQMYQSKSIVIGEEVLIYEDREDGSLKPITEGRVDSIGKQLELYLEGRTSHPVFNGRVVMRTWIDPFSKLGEDSTERVNKDSPPR